jgi:hypothetical protein
MAASDSMVGYLHLSVKLMAKWSTFCKFVEVFARNEQVCVGAVLLTLTKSSRADVTAPYLAQ